jgi:predicted membrane protein (TIGR00267 family)
MTEMQQKEIHEHTKGRGIMSNLILGIGDGMIVSLAFLTGVALNGVDLRILIITGASAVISNTVSMFFSGLLAKRTEIDLFNADYKRELYEIEYEPEEEKQEMMDIYRKKGLSAAESKRLVAKITKNKHGWLEDMLLNELHIHKDMLGSPILAGATIGLAALIGGIVPLAPYVFVSSLQSAIYTSVAIALLSLFVVGAIKGHVTKRNMLFSGLEILVVGIVAALIVFGIGKLLVFA